MDQKNGLQRQFAATYTRLPKDDRILTKSFQKMTASWKLFGENADKICPYKFTFELWIDNLPE